MRTESNTETAFLAARMIAQQRHIVPRCYGISSDALALYAIGVGPRPRVPGAPVAPGRTSWVGSECGREFPHDEDDLRACRLTYEMAPEHLQERMLPVLDEFTAWVREGRNCHGVVIEKMRNAGRRS